MAIIIGSLIVFSVLYTILHQRIEYDETDLDHFKKENYYSTWYREMWFAYLLFIGGLGDTLD